MSTPQHLPEMAAWDYERLRASIRDHGIIEGMEPFVTADGEVIDGRHRMRACAELGIDCPTRTIPPELTEAEAWDRYVWAMNLPRRHLSPRERRKFAAEYTRRHPEESNRAIARKIGIDDKTVGTIRAELEECAEIPHIDQPKTRDDYKNRALSPEAQAIQEAEDRDLIGRGYLSHEEDDARSPGNAHNHRAECEMEFVYIHPLGSMDVRGRDGTIYRRESGPNPWELTKVLQHRVPQTRAEAEAAADEIRELVLRGWLGDIVGVPMLPTLDPETAAWR